MQPEPATTSPLPYADKTTPARRSPRPAMIVLAVACCIDVLTTAALVYANYSALWRIAPGTPIRPMALAALDVTAGAGVFLTSLALSFVAVLLAWRWKRVWAIALLATALGLAPIFVAQSTSEWIIATHHLELEG